MAQAYEEEEGRCGEEDLVKSFFPSLFDSDSDSDDVYCLRSGQSDEADAPTSSPAQHSPQSSNVSCKTASVLASPVTKANSTSLLCLSRCHEALPDSGSPLSQENSSHTVFQPSALEPSSSIGDQSTFHSLLSMQSSSSLIDFDSVDDSPLKKRKVESPARMEMTKAPEARGQAVVTASQPLTLPSAATAPAVIQTQSSGSTAHTASVARPLCLPGSITTGVPVDSCSLPSGATPKSMPLGRSMPSNMGVAAYTAWPAQTQSGPPGHPLPHGQMMSNWRSPQAMIPTATAAPPGPPLTPGSKPAVPAADGPEKVSAALADISKAPLWSAPLGLKLDKMGVMQQLAVMGMRVTGT